MPEAEWPTPAAIAAAVDRIDAPAQEVEPKPADETPEEAPAPEKTKEPEEKTDIAAIAKTVEEKGPKAPEVKELLSSLDEATLEQLGQALLPKLQSKLSTRSNELRDARALVDTLRASDAAADRRHEELMTVGMSEEDKQKYIAEKTRKRSEELAQTARSAQASDAYILGTLWNIVNAAGLPVEMDARGLPRADADPDVKGLWDAVMNEADPQVAFRHFVMEAPKIAERRKAAKPSMEAPKPEAKTFTTDEVKEILSRGVNEALIKAGVLSADTGRSSGGGGRTAFSQNKNERIAEVTRRLSAL